MPLPQEQFYTSDDYWNLPEGQRAELINGQFYNLTPPSRLHQEIMHMLSWALENYIQKNGGSCKLYPSPFAVNLDASDEDWVEPDVSVICDKNKLTDRGCSGAPDFIIEVVSPSSRRHDYFTKTVLYANSGVREYWIVDPDKQRTTVYRYEENAAPAIYAFNQDITVGIYEDLSINVSDLLK